MDPLDLFAVEVDVKPCMTIKSDYSPLSHIFNTSGSRMLLRPIKSIYSGNTHSALSYVSLSFGPHCRNVRVDVDWACNSPLSVAIL